MLGCECLACPEIVCYCGAALDFWVQVGQAFDACWRAGVVSEHGMCLGRLSHPVLLPCRPYRPICRTRAFTILPTHPIHHRR